MKTKETKSAAGQNHGWQQNNLAISEKLYQVSNTLIVPSSGAIIQQKAIGHLNSEKEKGIASIQHMLENSPHVQQTTQLQSIFSTNNVSKEAIQRKENNTGLPDNLKSGVESLSGYSMDDVKVHYNSPKPKQLNALAYTQGTNIHVASGQKKYLPHEAWHVVQQKQGRVQPTLQMKGGVNVNADKGLEKEADVMGEKAIENLITNKNTSKLNLLTISPKIIQGKFEFEGNTYESKDYEPADYNELRGSDGIFTSVTADKNLPTFYAVLKNVYGDNVNEAFFSKTKDLLEENCDRPHKVTARINSTSIKQGRLGDPIVTAIGNLGNEELIIRDGQDDRRVTDYDGGHLVGYQIIGGTDADQEWNVAPQDKDNNEFAYNNTIELMARGANAGSIFDYTVELRYKSLNFEVDQNQLVSHGIINELAPDKFWKIQLPARIPQHWESRADLVSGQFGPPAKFGSDEEVPKAYRQKSVAMESALAHDDSTHTARYKLSFKGADDVDKNLDEDFSNIADIKAIIFAMHQVQPEDFEKKDTPEDYNEVLIESKFGAVEPDLITYDKVSDIRDQVVKDLENLEAMEVEEYEPKVLKKVLKPKLDGLSSTNKVAVFSGMFAEREERLKECEGARVLVEKSDKLKARDAEKIDLVKKELSPFAAFTYDASTPPITLSSHAANFKKARRAIHKMKVNKEESNKARCLRKRKFSELSTSIEQDIDLVDGFNDEELSGQLKAKRRKIREQLDVSAREFDVMSVDTARKKLISKFGHI